MDTNEQLRLVKKAVKGNPDAYGLLIAEHQEYLYKMAYLYVRNEDTALDVVGTAVLNAYQNIRTLKEPEYFKTWITRILIRIAQGEMKKVVYYSELDNVELPDRYTGVSLEEKYDINSDQPVIRKIPDRYLSEIFQRVHGKRDRFCHECTGRLGKSIFEPGTGGVKKTIEGGLCICKLNSMISTFRQKN